MSDTESTPKVDGTTTESKPPSQRSEASARSDRTEPSRANEPAEPQLGDARPRVGDTRPAITKPQIGDRRPQIGDSRPAPSSVPGSGGSKTAGGGSSGQSGQGDDRTSSGSAPKKRRRRRGKGGGSQTQGSQTQGQGSQTRDQDSQDTDQDSQDSRGRNAGPRGSQNGGGRRGDKNASGGQPRSNRQGSSGSKGGSGSKGTSGGRGSAKSSARSGGSRSRGGGRREPAAEPVEMVLSDTDAVELDETQLKKRSGRSRKGRPVGRYQMNVHVTPEATQISILEGRSLIEHYVSRPSDDITQIHGNIYVGRVENVLPGMEAAFIDIATPKNAVLYRGDVHYDPEDVLESGESPRIEDVLKPKQLILCQVTKNPIAHKGARLTQEVSLAGRFVVLVPNSKTYGISKRLPDAERKRLRKLLDRVKPAEHGIIVRTAAAGVTTEEVERDVLRLLEQWSRIEQLAAKQTRPGLIYREPELAVRFIREEFNSDYRAVMIDDKDLHLDLQEYVEAVAPALSDRINYYDTNTESLSLFDRFHITEQLTKTLDRKVWLPSGGSLIIEATEALTVIDVNTGRNVGSSSLEETVFKNNLEAADEIARQLRLRDIGGIIVIDFIDMEVKENRDAVVKRFRDALSRDKTRTQVFNISELGLVEMTRKRIGEGLLETVAEICEACDGRGRIIPPQFTR